ncbi:hypothetical protein R2R35_11815 [Anaerocolumna sp. AGMB13020]|uniref:hypothetical protein n=1 Tax=Anaerocolumna sp. AGMB13020 TaxID=3081750 RepID=UPI002952E24E|nr:hypothetical protein [Anaerocolumna sp. AGMB13020]WOO34502.1 hypothetical protein R2R35_11815 [Anaerocolumna sp. AGMB13020]
MIRTLFDNHVFIYILLALAGLGMLMKLVVQILYSKLLRASESMGTSKCKLAQNMKKKFEAYYKLKLGVNNVDIFVDKHFFHYKFCGIFLSTWETLCGQVLVLTLLTGAISTILGLIYECGKNQILSTFSVGILSCGLLIFLEGLINPGGKKEMIRLNMKDYLENSLKARLVQEENQPELMEQYKKVYQPDSYLATASEPKAFVNKQKKKSKSREAKRLEKLGAKARKKQEIENRKRNKELIKADKLKQKNNLKSNKISLRLEKKQNAEKLKAERLAAKELLKTQALEEKQRLKEDKLHQIEIKKALKLEKQTRKRPKNQTVAQTKKETLLREVQGRRGFEGNQTNSEKEDTAKASTIESKAAVTEVIAQEAAMEANEPDTVKMLQEENAAKVITNTTADAKEVSEKKMVSVDKAAVKEATVTDISTRGVKAANIKEAQPRKAEINAAQTGFEKGKKEAFIDDKTAAALETGKSYKRDVTAVKPTSEEEEKIIAEILKDLFA